jgi:hypothetical protein
MFFSSETNLNKTMLIEHRCYYTKAASPSTISEGAPLLKRTALPDLQTAACVCAKRESVKIIHRFSRQCTKLIDAFRRLFLDESQTAPVGLFLSATGRVSPHETTHCHICLAICLLLLNPAPTSF